MKKKVFAIIAGVILTTSAFAETWVEQNNCVTGQTDVTTNKRKDCDFWICVGGDGWRINDDTIKIHKLDGRGSEHRCSLHKRMKTTRNGWWKYIDQVCVNGHARSNSAGAGGRGRVECKLEAFGEPFSE